MLIKGELKLEDLIALQKNHFRTSEKVIRRNRNAIIIAVIVMFILLFLLYPSLSPLMNAYKVIVITLVAILAPMLQEKVVVWKLKRTNYQKQLVSIEVDMHEKGIQLQREDTTKQFAWQDILRVTRDEYHYFIYVADQSAIILPDHAVHSKKEFVTFLSSHLDARKVKLEPAVRPRRKITVIFLLIALVVVLGLHYFYLGSAHNIAKATNQVQDLFVVEEGEENKPNESSKIKPSTDQKQIDKAMMAVQKIDKDTDVTSERHLIAMGLEASILVAQNQLNQRENNEDADSSQEDDESLGADDNSEPYKLEEEIDRESDDYKRIVHKIFGMDVYIPKFDDFDITSIKNTYSIIMGEEYLEVKYAKDKRELEDEEYIEGVESGLNTIILYGIYDSGPLGFKITYHKKEHFTTLENTKEIKGVPIEYEMSGNNTFKASFTSDKGTYETQFNLDEISEKVAFAIIEKMTSEIND